MALSHLHQPTGRSADGRQRLHSSPCGCAFAANLAELRHAELDRFVWHERYVDEHFAQPDAFEHVVFLVARLGIAGLILGFKYTPLTP